MKNIKKYIAISLILCTICSFCGCKSETSNKASTKKPAEVTTIKPADKTACDPSLSKVSIITNSDNLEIVAKELMSKYFDLFKIDTVSKEMQIEDYKIKKISEIKGDSSKFSFSISYDLKPADIKSYVLAGNGTLKDSWVIDKSYYVEVEKSNNEYKIINMGTGK